MPVAHQCHPKDRQKLKYHRHKAGGVEVDSTSYTVKNDKRSFIDSAPIKLCFLTFLGL